MILVDLNQVMISNLMMQIGGKNVPIEEDLVRHMVLNSLRLYRRKFGEKFGELVICRDDKNYWQLGFYHTRQGRQDQACRVKGRSRFT